MIYHTPGYFTSRLITLPHGFSTRAGGVSSLDHLASMNFTTSTGDSEANVAQNYAIFLSALGLAPESRVSASQIHSTRVRYVTEADRGRVFDDCDGFVTDRSGVTLIAKTADCVPILMADANSGVVSAVHAGWRGTVGGIAPNALAEMVKRGASLEDIRVAIGACIHDCCFEVQRDFIEAVTALRGQSFADAHVYCREGRFYADLPSMNYALLLECGIAPEAIDCSPDCTCCHPDRYHSHRYTRGHRGTMAAAIALG